MNTYEVNYQGDTTEMMTSLFSISNDYLYFYTKQDKDLEIVAVFAPGKWDNVYFVCKED